MPLANGELTMADDVLAANLAGIVADAYGCYDNGRWPDAMAVAAEHPGSRIVDFTVYLANVGTGGDVERGDMTPQQGAVWLGERQRSGVWRPIGYASIGDDLNGMPALLREARAAGIADGSWRRLSAHYGWPGQLPGLERGQHICGPSTCGAPIQCDGTQWFSGPNFDLSLLAADFFGPPVPAPTAPAVASAVGMAVTQSGNGYWVVGSTGVVHSFGDAPPAPALPALRKPIVGVAGRAGGGFWLAASDGGVFAEDGAPFRGSAGNVRLVRPVVGLAGVPDGNGYWLAASDGGVFTYGDAGFYGSAGADHLRAPAVGMAASPTGKGYLLAASDGGVFNYGDARFHGSLGGIRLAEPVVGIAGRPQGDGYWLVAADGGVFTFGAASFHGSTGGIHLRAPVVGMAPTPTGNGYYLVAADGGIFTFGDAHFRGSAA